MGTKICPHNYDVIAAFLLEISKKNFHQIDSPRNFLSFRLDREFSATFFLLLWPFEVDKNLHLFSKNWKKISGAKGLIIVGKTLQMSMLTIKPDKWYIFMRFMWLPVKKISLLNFVNLFPPNVPIWKQKYVLTIMTS